MDLQALLDALTGLPDNIVSGITAALPRLISLGIIQFLGELGHTLYAWLGGFWRGVNLVTRMPPEWTTENALVLVFWEGMRWLANGLLGLTLLGSLWEQGRNRDGDVSAIPMRTVENVFYGALGVNLSMDIARQVFSLLNPIYDWIANLPLEQMVPGWQQASAADIRTAEGIGLLAYGIEAALLWLHALASGFFFMGLLVMMPLAIWCATMPFDALQHWWGVWLKAIGGALGAKLMLGVLLRLSVAVFSSGFLQASWPEVPTAVMGLFVGAAGLLVTLKVASMGHAGVELFHPFATAGRARRSASTVSRAAFIAVATPFMGTAAAPVAAASAAASAPPPSLPSVPLMGTPL